MARRYQRQAYKAMSKAQRKYTMKDLLEQLQQIMPMAAQATEGPWHIGRWRQGNERWAPTLTPEMGAPICRMDRHGAPHKDAADAAFIAAARNLLTPQNLMHLYACVKVIADSRPKPNV